MINSSGHDLSQIFFFFSFKHMNCEYIFLDFVITSISVLGVRDGGVGGQARKEGLGTVTLSPGGYLYIRCDYIF